MEKPIIHKLYYVLIPILVIGVSLGYTTFLVSLLALVPLLLTTSRHTVAIFFVMYGGVVAGIIRATYPSVPLYGQLIEVVGLFLMWDLVIDLFKEHIGALIGLILVLVFFGLFYLLGPMTPFATSKYGAMWYHGLFMLAGYYVFDRSSKIDAEGLTLILMVSSMCLFAYVIHSVSMRSASLFDYDWFRQQAVMYQNMAKDSEDGLLTGYQQIGMLSLFALAIYLSQNKLKPILSIFYIICCTQLVLVSGCRQAILGVLLVISLRYVVFRADYDKKKKIPNLLIMAVGVIITYLAIKFFLENIQSELISNTLEEGDQARIILYLESLSIFSDNPLMGCGLGGYNAITGEPWPHNFILELLCETGVIGTFVALTSLVSPLLRQQYGLYHLTKSKQFFFLILVAIFVRVMFSGDFRISIELFSAMFAVKAANKIPAFKNILRNK